MWLNLNHSCPVSSCSASGADGGDGADVLYTACVGVSVQPVVAVDTPVLELLHHINILSQERHGPFSRPFPSQVDLGITDY